MRRFLQKQLLGLLESMREAIRYLQTTAPDCPEALLEDCQNGLSTVFNLLESQLSEKGFFRYEPFCAPLEAIVQQKTPQKAELLQADRLLAAFFHQLQQEPEVKLEILFLPYKYAMWDCMESIWRAAKDDPSCHASLVLIPYYDRDEQGRMSTFHYERAEFPEEFPIIFYKQYDLEQMHPDIIYFNNPYDDTNKITCVEPTYYSVNLKNYTECLVYVPYYLSSAYISTESIETSYIAAGMLNAHALIAQSQAHKQMFLDVGFSAETVFALGNPKTDKIASLSSTPIPKEWVERCAGKKVFLYISSLLNMMACEAILPAIRNNVLALASAPQAVVIWRPHPLMLQSVRSMRPDLLPQVQALYQQVQSMSNVILDETTTCNAALCLSDALLGEQSSVLFEYGLTGKPVLCTDIGPHYFETHQHHYIALDYSGYYFVGDSPKTPGTSVEAFRDMVLNGEDPGKEQRLSRLKKSLLHSEGDCGKSVHQAITQKLRSE